MCAVQGVTASQPSLIRHSTFGIRHFTYARRFMDHDHAHQHLSASETRVAALIARSRRYEIKPAVSIRPFDALGIDRLPAIKRKSRRDDLEPRPCALSQKKMARSEESPGNAGRYASWRRSFARQNCSVKGSRCKNNRSYRAIWPRTSSDER